MMKMTSYIIFRWYRSKVRRKSQWAQFKGNFALYQVRLDFISLNFGRCRGARKTTLDFGRHWFLHFDCCRQRFAARPRPLSGPPDASAGSALAPRYVFLPPAAARFPEMSRAAHFLERTAHCCACPPLLRFVTLFLSLGSTVKSTD